MNEREMLKKIIENDLPDKEKIRLASIKKGTQKSRAKAKRMLLAAACISLLLCLPLTLPFLKNEDKPKEILNEPVETNVKIDTKETEEAIQEIPKDKIAGYGIPESFIRYVGVDNYIEWIDEVSQGDYLCSEFVLEFVKTFDIPNELMLKEYAEDYPYWNINLMMIL